jgi:hypothetical protein
LTGFVSLAFTPHVFATPDGTYTGTASGNYFTSACSPPGVDTGGVIPYSGASVTLNVAGGGSSITMAFSHSAFVATAVGSESGGTFTMDFSPGDFHITIQQSGLNLATIFSSASISGAALPVVVGAGSAGGSTSNCSSAQIDWNAITFSAPSPSPSPGGSEHQVNPEETPSTTLTAPLILKSEINAIVSDLQYRINDVMRAWQLRLKQFSSPRTRGSLSATGDDGEVVADTREQEDSQTPVRIQRTGSGLMMNSMSGMNAGDSNYLYGAWASYSYTDFENDFASTAFDGSRHGGLIGLDVSPWEGVLLGVAVGYEDTDIDTDFNLGNQETDGFTVAPYLGALINDTWSVSASFGYSSLDTDQFRTLTGTTTRVTSSPDSDRWFAMFNLNGLTTYDNWIIGGQIGILYARNEIDAYVETNSTTGATTLIADFDAKLTQFNIGADVAYSYGEFEPFARVMYENDLSQTEVGVIGGPQPSFDDDDVMLGFGLRYFGANNLTGNLEFNTRLGRDDYDEYDISAVIRYDW